MLHELYDGAKAGTAATVPMSALMLAADALGIMNKPAPGEITEDALAEAGVEHPRGPGQDALTVVAHFGYGAATGALYGALRDRLPLSGSPTLQGMLYALGVWAASYEGWIPEMNIMPPPERDRPGRPSTMIMAHLVYGAALGRRLARG